MVDRYKWYKITRHLVPFYVIVHARNELTLYYSNQTDCLTWKEVICEWSGRDVCNRYNIYTYNEDDMSIVQSTLSTLWPRPSASSAYDANAIGNQWEKLPWFSLHYLHEHSLLYLSRLAVGQSQLLLMFAKTCLPRYEHIKVIHAITSLQE